MFSVIASMLIVDAFAINHYQRKVAQDSKVLSVVYDTKSTIENFHKRSNQIYRENEFDIKEEILILKSSVSYLVDLLQNGGKTTTTGLTLLPASPNSTNLTSTLKNNWNEAKLALDIIHKVLTKADSTITDTIVKEEIVDSIYQEVTKTINRVILIPNPEMKKALSQFSIHKSLLTKNLDQLVSLTVSEYNTHQNNYNTVLILTILCNLLIVALFVWLMSKEVIAPLSKISYLTAKVADGEKVEIKYNKPDEIGSIVDSIQSLGNHLRQASDFAHQIGEGNLEASLSDLNTERDKDGSLAHSLIAMQNKLKSVSNEGTIRNWNWKCCTKISTNSTFKS